MVQLNEWTGGTMCRATTQMWALQEESWGMHTAHMGEMPLDSWTKRSLPLWGNAGSAFVLLVSRESYLRCQNMGGKHQEGKRIPFLVLLWILGGEEAGPLQRPEHFCRRLDSPLTHSKVIMDPVTYNPKKLRKNTLASPSPSPSHLLSLHLWSGLQGTYVL